MVDVIELDKKAENEIQTWKDTLKVFQTDLQDITNDGRDIPLIILKGDYQRLKAAQGEMGKNLSLEDP